MKKSLFFRIIAVLLSAVMLLSLVACGGDGNDGNDDNPSDTPTGEAEYIITIKDGGNVPEYTLIVEVLKDGERVAMRKVDKNGQVKVKLERGNYTVALKGNDGDKFFYDEAKSVLTPENLTLDISVSKAATPKGSHTIYPPFGDGRGEAYDAKIISTGKSYVEIDRADMAYFIFNPDEGGIYRISVTDKSIDLGYYGNPFAVQNIKLLETVDGSFEIPIYDSSIGTETSAMIVIGLSAGEIRYETIVIERIGDIPPGPPETIVQPTELPVSFEKVDYLNHKLVDISVTDRNVKVVYNNIDGYYHYGTEDGPRVYVRISSQSPYILSPFSEIETRIWHNIYDLDGEVSERHIYNFLINSYEAVCDQNGICPLTTEIKNMLQKVGEQFGWWDFENTGRNIFMYDADGNLTSVNELTIVKGNEWMFPLCYVEEFVYGDGNPIMIKPEQGKDYSVMVREEGAVSFVSDKAGTLVIENANGISVNYGGNIYSADSDGNIRVVIKANDLAFSVSGPDRASVTLTFENVAIYYNPINNADFSVIVEENGTTVVVISKTATLVLENAPEGLKVVYAGNEYTADADGKITVAITADDLSFSFESESRVFVPFTFTDVNK